MQAKCEQLLQEREVDEKSVNMLLEKMALLKKDWEDTSEVDIEILRVHYNMRCKCTT